MNEHDAHRQGGRRRFCIRVTGRLGEGFTEGIGAVEQRDTEGVTTLSGDLEDQSQVHGILDQLRGLGIEVLHFEIGRPDVPRERPDEQEVE